MADSFEDINKVVSKARSLRRKPAADLSSFVYGRIPPQARDLEEAVLGALMLEKDALSLVIDILKPEAFYVEAHNKIFAAIQRLFLRSQPVDILTVTDELRKSGELESAGGAYYVTELTNRVASAANVEYHARIVSQKYIQRELIRISSEIVRDAFEDTTDVFELLDFAEKGIYEITDQNLRRNYNPISALVTKALNQLQAIKDHKDTVTGVPSGFVLLDRITSGWQRSDLIIVAARPGMGKTAFVLSLARNAAIDFKKPVAFFSLEMSSIQLTNRLISAETEIPAEKIRRANLESYEWEQLVRKVDELSECALFIDDTPAINIFELRAKARRLKMQHDIQMIIIDYLQLMSGTVDSKQGNREQEISNISRALKSIAKELDIPVIALSQLNRSVETRGGDKRPQLSDLRESGAIEQDADMVIFIYRPEYYKLTEDADGNSTVGLAEIMVAKHRNGALANVPVKFIDRFAKFAEMDSFEKPNTESNVRILKSRMDDMEDEDESKPTEEPLPW
ncbi:MAG: replicative DNA helicase [Chitinophagales bacterium]|nr:replicative DNA helicase [Chitinophagales bacterium]